MTSLTISGTVTNVNQYGIQLDSGSWYEFSKFKHIERPNRGDTVFLTYTEKVYNGKPRAYINELRRTQATTSFTTPPISTSAPEPPSPDAPTASEWRIARSTAVKVLSQMLPPESLETSLHEFLSKAQAIAGWIITGQLPNPDEAADEPEAA